MGKVARRFTDGANIATQGLSVWPSHDYEGSPSGFEARHSLAIGCPGVAEAGELVAALAAEVGNRVQVESVGLEVADRVAAEGEAREAAWADARARAAHLAGLAGSELAEVQAVSEGGPHPAGGPATPAGYLSKMEVAFEPGQSEVRAALTVTFQLV
jgi:uncharacterized protein YggE